MSSHQPDFDALRPYLMGLSYRILGSRSDAEDAVQDTWVRFQQQTVSPDNFKAWLTRVCTNICLDNLRRLKRERQHYEGPWLPDPLKTQADAFTGAPELAESLQLAYMLLLERLTPTERASFLLHDVFGFSFMEIADILHLDAQAARQQASRARKHLKASGTRFDTSHEDQAALGKRLEDALANGNIAGVVKHLATDVEMWSDGGGKALAARNVVFGPEKVAAFISGLYRKAIGEVQTVFEVISGQPSIRMLDQNAQTIAIMNISCNHEGKINRVLAHRNPDKLECIKSPTHLI